MHGNLFCETFDLFLCSGFLRDTYHSYTNTSKGFLWEEYGIGVPWNFPNSWLIWNHSSTGLLGLEVSASDGEFGFQETQDVGSFDIKLELVWFHFVFVCFLLCMSWLLIWSQWMKTMLFSSVKSIYTHTHTFFVFHHIANFIYTIYTFDVYWDPNGDTFTTTSCMDLALASTQELLFATTSGVNLVVFCLVIQHHYILLYIENWHRTFEYFGKMC